MRVKMDPQTTDSSDHEHDGESDPQKTGYPMTKKLRIWLISIFVALAVPLVGVISVAYMINGEEICLDRHPGWGPPESGTNAECGNDQRPPGSP